MSAEIRQEHRSRAARREIRRRRQRRDSFLAAAIAFLVIGAAGGAIWIWKTSVPSRAGVETAPAEQSVTPTATDEATTSAETTTSADATTPLGPALPADFGQPATITVAAVGDMLFDRRVGAYIRAQGGKAPLSAVAERLSAADVTVGNLESVLGTTGQPVKNKEYTFRGRPEAIEGLKSAGFDALSLANNHALDYGPEPLQETLKSLDTARIGHAGAGKNTDAAWAPALIRRPRARIAYLAFTHTLPPGFLAGPERWGVAFGRNDKDRFIRAVKDAKRQNDYVIVSFHWGVELTDNATAKQVEWAHRAIDAGADMVLGHHPHVIQAVEFYKGRLIAYSQGDFVWDHSKPKSGESFILEAKLGPSGVTDAVAYPVYMQESTGKPEYASEKMSKTILERLASVSERHGTKVVSEGERARLLPDVR